jgi:DNA-directed RNA polymerase alpha subunit
MPASDPCSFAELGQRTREALAAEGIHNIQQLCSRTEDEVMNLPGIGIRDFHQIAALLRNADLILRVDAPDQRIEQLHITLAETYSEGAGFGSVGARFGVSRQAA